MNTQTLTPTPTLQPTKTSTKDLNRALRTVILWTISDAFALESEEVIWVQYQLSELLQPHQNTQPQGIPLPVQRELCSQMYTQLLTDLNKKTHSTARPQNGHSLQASVQDWAYILSEMVTQTYELRPLHAASIVGIFTGILSELGVGHPSNPRASLYLPNAVREKLNES